MKRVQGQQVIENIKIRRQTQADELLARTKLIRKRLTMASKDWDAVTVLRGIRYAS